MSENLSKLNQLEQKKAKAVTPVVLEYLGGEVGKNLANMAGPICKALTTYSCRNQLAITKMVCETCPAFAQIADKFFNVLNQTLKISAEIDTKNYEVILDAIFKDETATIQEKTRLAKETIETIKTQHRENIKTVIEATGTVVLKTVALISGVIAVEALTSLEKTRVKEKGKTDRTRAVSDTVGGMIRDLNPLNTIKDTVTTVSQNRYQVRYGNKRPSRYKK